MGDKLVERAFKLAGHLAKEKAVHSRNHIGNCGAYVEQEKKNGFD